MTHNISEQLKVMDIALPIPAAPVSNYVGAVKSGSTLYISGQLPIYNESAIKGCVGKNVDLEQAQLAAKYCAINILAQVQHFIDGDWSRVKRCVKLGGFVASTPEFTDQHKVVNGASDLIVKVLGNEVGKHARFAVGVSALPLGVAVEVDAIFEVE